MRVRVRVNALCMLLIVSSELTTFTVWGADLEMEAPVRVVIQGRQLNLIARHLHQGQKTTLVFKNQDSELNAMVPFGLFVGVLHNISGNGVPEF